MRHTGWFGRTREAASIDREVLAFESKMDSGWPGFERFWAGLGSKQTPSMLAALVKVDLRRRFEQGERPRVLDYLGKFSLLSEDGDRVISLVYEEFCLLQECGANPDSKVFCDDYSRWRDSLASQLAYHRELSRAVGAESPSVNFPSLGERFDKYRLTSILGEGGVARVYLATEDELGGRQLAIKVSASFGREPSILAKLDHPNIVPIWTVAESPTGLCGICMPYRPGLTLDDLIRRIGRGKPPRSARAIDEVLRARNLSSSTETEDQRTGWSDFPIDRTFPEAVAWIGLALSDALSYLHKQGIYHRDIKPANILMAFREGPQLLDFNLAQEPCNPEQASAAQKGGTLPYMAPEQLKAFLDSSAWGTVGESADVYSLGLVLRELLTGRPPEIPAPQGSLPRVIQSILDRRAMTPESIREINPGVPPALESILSKCLAFRPEDRYAHAHVLSEDLRLFIDRKPLTTASNPSKVERCFNWIFRNRHVLLATVLTAAVLWSILGVYLRRNSPVGEFLKAEACLDSGRPEELDRARKAFEKLHREHPNLARATLGLAFTIIKQGQSSKDTSDLIKDGLKKPDAEDVLWARLEKEPNSEMLNLNLGIVLTEKKKFDEARNALNRALQVNPEGIMTLVSMSQLDQNTGRESEAIRGMDRAIELGQKHPKLGKVVYDLRLAELHALIKLVDRKLSESSSDKVHHEIEESLERIERNLSALDDDWYKISKTTVLRLHPYYVNYLKGCLNSLKGARESEKGGLALSESLFDQAEESFAISRLKILRGDPLEKQLLKDQTEQETKLELRRKLAASRG